MVAVSQELEGMEKGMPVSKLTIHFLVEAEYNDSCQKILIFGFQRVA
jgi:hypothetical protein